MKYRKKPIVIEAYQLNMFEINEDDWPAWLQSAARTPKLIEGSFFRDMIEGYYVRTLEGIVHVDHLDYIIKGVKNELYPCKPDIFALTYDKVTSDNV